jgi:hypothetical protein
MTTGLARCRACDKVYASDRPPQREPARQRPRVPKPEKLVERSSPVLLEIEAPWFNWGAIFLLLFSGVWFGFLTMWYSIAFSTGGGPGGMMLWFPLVHVAVGLFIGYRALTSLLNKSIFRVSASKLTVSHGPLPWPGGGEHSTSSIDQFYVCEHRGNKGARSYKLYARIDGMGVPVSAAFDSPETPRYLEQRFEDHLRLGDERVDGETI